MGMNDTPSGERVHIAFRPAAMPGNRVSSTPLPAKICPSYPIPRGRRPTLFIRPWNSCPWDRWSSSTRRASTTSELGEERVRRTKQVLNKTDIAVVIVDGTEGLATADEDVVALIRSKGLLSHRL